jgi:hypothetical protein
MAPSLSDFLPFGNAVRAARFFLLRGMTTETKSRFVRPKSDFDRGWYLVRFGFVFGAQSFIFRNIVASFLHF